MKRERDADRKKDKQTKMVSLVSNYLFTANLTNLFTVDFYSLNFTWCFCDKNSFVAMNLDENFKTKSYSY